MKHALFLVALMFSAATLAHTPVCRCELNSHQVDCEGAYDDGSKAAEVSMFVFAYTGEVLATGKLNQQSRFNFPLPSHAFYVLMDVGPGEMFEVDWRDIQGVDQRRFHTSELNETQ